MGGIDSLGHSLGSCFVSLYDMDMDMYSAYMLKT